jgi:hypothetical protein
MMIIMELVAMIMVIVIVHSSSFSHFRLAMYGSYFEIWLVHAKFMVDRMVLGQTCL